MTSSVVKRISSWVEPAGPVDPEFVKLSAVDNQCSKIYSSGFWFFHDNPDTKDPLVHFEHMKRGLARMIYQFPLNTGTLREDERGFMNVEIPPAPGAGATCHYLDISEDPNFPTMEQLAQANYPIMDCLTDGLQALRPDPFPTASDGDPVLVVQMTRLKGGFVILGCSTHVIGDLLQPQISLSSMAVQMKEVADAAAEGIPEPPLPWRLPLDVYDRSRLSPTPSKILSYDEVQRRCDSRGDWFIMNPDDPMGSAERLFRVVPQAHLTAAERLSEDELRSVTAGIWTIPLKSLQALQGLAAQFAETKLTTANVVTAFIWQRYYVAKYGLAGPDQGASDREMISTLVFPGDVRGRMNPPLPQLYLGAAIDVFRVTQSEKSLVPETYSPENLGRTLAAVATAVKGANERWNEDQYQEFMELSVSTPNHATWIPQGPLDLFITDHSKAVAFRDADWGHGLGVALEQRQPYLGRDMPPGEATVLPRRRNGDIPVMMAAEKVVLQRLLKDDLMQRFTSPIFMTQNVPEALCGKQAFSKARL